MIIAGVPAATLPKDSYSEKLDAVKEMSGAAFLALCETNGFCAVLEASDLVAIPADHVIVEIVVGGAEVHGLRYSLHGSKKNMAAAKSGWDLYTQSFPSVCNEGTPGAVMSSRYQTLVDACDA